MKRTQVDLPDDLYRDLKLLAETKKTNISKLIQLGASMIIEEEKRLKPGKDYHKFIGIISSGKKTNSVDEIKNYYEDAV